MSSVAKTLSDPEKKDLESLYSTYDKTVSRRTVPIVTSSFLILGALIVITSSCLCLLLPGVNVMSQVILPGIIPGVAAIVVSLPWILQGVKASREANSLRPELIDMVLFLLNKYFDPKEEKKKIAKFFIQNFLKEEWMLQKKQKIISELKEKLKNDDKNSPQMKMSEALDEALRIIYKKYQ